MNCRMSCKKTNKQASTRPTPTKRQKELVRRLIKELCLEEPTQETPSPSDEPRLCTSALRLMQDPNLHPIAKAIYLGEKVKETDI